MAPGLAPANRTWRASALLELPLLGKPLFTAQSLATVLATSQLVLRRVCPIRQSFEHLNYHARKPALVVRALAMRAILVEEDPAQRAIAGALGFFRTATTLSLAASRVYGVARGLSAVPTGCQALPTGYRA